MTPLDLAGVLSMIFVVWFTQRAYRDNTRIGGRQSRREDIVEAWVNIILGFSVNFLCNLILLPVMTQGGHLSLWNNFLGGWVFTAISIGRQYGIRRIAHRIHAFVERATALIFGKLS